MLENVHDEVVHLGQNHKVHGETRAPVLCGRVTGQPGEGVVLFQNKSNQNNKQAKKTQQHYNKSARR